MSTRSMIGIQNEDGTVTGIYCHFDGYPDGVGATLVAHYQDEAKIRALVALGDLSSLGAEIGEQHSFDACPDGVCNAYGRDRGEQGVDAQSWATADAFQKDGSMGTEYRYLWSDGRWAVTDYNGRTRTLRLKTKKAG